MEILILFGAPFSGKGTQGKILSQRTGFKHLSTGDILRKERSMQTPLGLAADEYIKNGQLVPDKLLDAMIESVIVSSQTEKGVILDGYPRTINQAKTLDLLVQKHNVVIKKVLFLNVSHSELLVRGRNRAKDSNRIDDKDPAIMARRIEVYKKETKPVGQFYIDKNLSVSIDGMGEVSVVADRIFKQI